MADRSSAWPIDLEGLESPGTRLPVAEAVDADLLTGLQAGSEAAYEALILRFQHPVSNLVSRLLEDPNDTFDAVQEVFLKVFRKIGSFRGQSSLKTWVYRIAVNEALNQRRSFLRHRHREVGLEAPAEGGLGYQDIVPDAAPSPFDLLENRQMAALVEEALTEINGDFRAAVVLRDLEEMSYEEIAAVLDLNLGTVKSRIRRGRDALRERLEWKMAQRRQPPECRKLDQECA
jgi:RNA polymerase sigma-70 factor (ECF subfamily)